MQHLFFYLEIQGDEMIIDVSIQQRPDPRARSRDVGILTMPIIAGNEFLYCLRHVDTSRLAVKFHVIPPAGALTFSPTEPAPQPKPHRDTAHG